MNNSQEENKKENQDNALYKTFMAAALRLIALRARSRKEVRDYLVKKGVKEDLREKILAKLTQSNFINDRKFAEWLIESRQNVRKPKGKRLIQYELEQKGIDGSIIDELLSNSVSDSQTAFNLILQKKRRFENLPPLDRQKKIASFLQSRGFDWETVSKVLKSIKQNGFTEKMGIE